MWVTLKYVQRLFVLDLYFYFRQVTATKRFLTTTKVLHVLCRWFLNNQRYIFIYLFLIICFYNYDNIQFILPRK